MTTEREEDVQRDLGRYRLGIRPLLALRHFDGNEKALDGVLARLVEQRRIQVHKNCLPNGHSVYQLTKAAALALGFSEARAQRLGPRAIPEHLSVLWFCCAYDGIRRGRLEDHEVAQLLGQKLPGTHCAEVTLKSAGRPLNRLYRVLVPGPTAEDTYTLKKLHETLDEVRHLRERHQAPFAPAEWLAERRYALAVLVDNEDRRRRMAELVKRAGLLEETHVLVERTVAPETLSRTLQEEFYVRTQTTALAAIPSLVPRGGTGTTPARAATPTPPGGGTDAGDGTGLPGK